MLGESGQWIAIPFLADSGADRTVLSIDAFESLAFTRTRSDHAMVGIGGSAEAFEFSSVIRMRRDDGVIVHFRGRFAATADPIALDMSVRERDITNLLALIVDRPSDTVCLLSRGETYHA